MPFGSQYKKSGLGACQRALKERQCQNWQGKKLLPNFPMKMKAAQFVFTNHWQSMKINVFIKPGVPLRPVTTWSTGRLFYLFQLSPGSSIDGFMHCFALIACLVIWKKSVLEEIIMWPFGQCNIAEFCLIRRENSTDLTPAGALSAGLKVAERIVGGE